MHFGRFDWAYKSWSAHPRMHPAGCVRLERRTQPQRAREQTRKSSKRDSWWVSVLLSLLVVGLCLLCAGSCEWWMLRILLLFYTHAEWAPVLPVWLSRVFLGIPQVSSCTNQATCNTQAGRPLTYQWAARGQNNCIMLEKCRGEINAEGK